MQLVRWHTPPPDLPRYAENTKIELNATYNKASPLLRARLDEFVGFLESKDFRPLETFTELTYRYRDLYNEIPPMGLSHVALFVRVATLDELQAAVSAGWKWDRQVLTDPGYDCVGNPAKIWTLHHYSENVQNFKLPARDPVHHYGITRLGTHTEMYACCGLPLSNPGCWMGEQKFKISPYVMAPSFGALIWDYVVSDDWDSAERLWLNSPKRGTMWLHKEKYDAWDRQIRDGKQQLTGAIIDAFRAVKREPNKINPLLHMEPMDRMQFEGLLDLQNRYNAIQCQAPMSSAEFFKLELGAQKLKTAKLVTKFDLARVNLTWEKEREETTQVSQKNGPEIQRMLGEYTTYLNEMEYFQELVETEIEPELQNLPQFDSLRADPSNRLIREHFNQVIMGDILYDPTILPDMSEQGNLWKRYQAFAFANRNVDNVDQYDGPLSITDISYSPTVQNYLNQYWVLDALRSFGVVTDDDVAELQSAEDKVKMTQKIEDGRIDAFFEALLAEKNEDAFADLLERAMLVDLSDPDAFNRFLMDYQRIKVNLELLSDLQEQLDALRQEFPDNIDDLKELQKIITDPLTLSDAREQFLLKVNQMRDNKEQYVVPQERLEQARKWVEKYALDSNTLAEDFENLKNSQTESDAREIYNKMSETAALEERIISLFYAISLEENTEAYEELVKKLRVAARNLSHDVLDQLILEFDKIKQNLADLQDLKSQLDALKQEFRDSLEDLEELNRILTNADPLELDDARDQFLLKVEQMRATKEDVWVFEAYSQLEGSDSNIQKILEPFIAQVKAQRYNNWTNLRKFARRLKRSELFNIVRIFKGRGAKKCIDAFKKVLEDIEGKPLSFVEGYFGSERVVMDTCLSDLENRWQYLKVSEEYDTFSPKRFEQYLEGKKEVMPELYDFFKSISDISRQDCQKYLMRFLRALDGKPRQDVKSLLNSDDAKALRNCMPSGYGPIVELLKDYPDNFEIEFVELLSRLSSDEYGNARALLDEAGAVEDPFARIRELINEPTTSESDFQDFVRQVKLEPEKSRVEELMRKAQELRRVILAEGAEEEEEDI